MQINLYMHLKATSFVHKKSQIHCQDRIFISFTLNIVVLFILDLRALILELNRQKRYIQQ